MLFVLCVHFLKLSVTQIVSTVCTCWCYTGS